MLCFNIVQLREQVLEHSLYLHRLISQVHHRSKFNSRSSLRQELIMSVLTNILCGPAVTGTTSLAEPFADVFQSEPDLLMAIIRRLIDKDSSMRYVVMNNLFSVPQAKRAIKEMNINLRYGMKISRPKWVNRISPMFQNLSSILSGSEVDSHGRPNVNHIQMIHGKNSLEDDYRELTDIYVPKQQIAHLPDGQPVTEFNAVHYPMVKLLQLQLSTPSIRSAMHFHRISTVVRPRFDTDRVVIGEHTLTIKVCRDGFVLSMGRMLEMTLMVNCNVRGLANSKQHAEIVSLATVQENDVNLYLLCQQVDSEMLILQLFGIVDPKSGQLITLVFLNAEDSSSAEKGFGRPNSRSDGRWLWSKFGESTHLLKFDTVHCPISITAKWVEDKWDQFVRDKFQRYCDRRGIHPNFAQFEDATRFAQYHAKKEDFTSSFKYLKKSKEKYGFTRGRWNRAVDHRQCAFDPLHCGIRITILTGKYTGLGLMDYHVWIMHQDQNELRHLNHCDHPGQQCGADNERCADSMIAMSHRDILHHLRYHAKLDLRYDKDNPGRSSVRARMYHVFHCAMLFCESSIHE